MSTIQLTGLTNKQKALADILWQYDTLDQVNAFIDTLASPSKEEASTILELMKLAVLDQEDPKATEEFTDLMERINASRG